MFDDVIIHFLKILDWLSILMNSPTLAHTLLDHLLVHEAVAYQGRWSSSEVRLHRFQVYVVQAEFKFRHEHFIVCEVLMSEKWQSFSTTCTCGLKSATSI